MFLLQYFYIMYNKFEAPEILTSPTLIVSLQLVTTKIMEQVDNLKIFMKDYHKIYHKFSKDLQKLSEGFQRKIQKSASPINLSVMEFLKSMQNMAKCIEKQANKNLANFKANKTQKDSKIFEALIQKLGNVKQLIAAYQKLSKQLKSQQQLYVSKAARFENIENDTIKYYATEYFKHKFQKITKIESILEIQIEQLKRQQTDIQLQFKEIKKLFFQLFDFEMRKIRQMLYDTKLIIHKLVNLDAVIAQENSIQEASVRPEQFKFNEQSFVQVCSQFFNRTKQNFLICSEVRQSFYYYLQSVILLIDETKQELISLQKTDNYKAIVNQHMVIEEFLGNKIYQEFTQGLNQVFKFYTLFEKINSKLDRQKIFEEMINSQKLKFESFLKQAIHTLQVYKKHKKQIQGKIKLQSQFLKEITENAYKEIFTEFKKFKVNEEVWNNNFQLEIGKIVGEIKNIFKSYQVDYPLANKSGINDNQISKIFTRRYFEIFINQFITHPIEFKFEQSQFIQDYVKLNNLANNLQNITLDLIEEEDVRKSQTNTIKYKTGCCGLIRVNNQSNENQVLDQFNCALINGFLLQGKLYMLRKQIRFISSFNKHTFFGRTQIQIPKRDIFKIEHDASVFKIIIIGTTHGQIKFTSFLSDPLPSLKKFYLENKQKLNPIFPQQPYIQYEKSISRTYETTTVFDIREVKQKVIETLIKTGYSKSKNDCYTRSFVNCSKQIKCEVYIEHNNNIFQIQVYYKSYQNPSEYYLIKIMKPQSQNQRVHCVIEDNQGQNCLMRQKFQQLCNSILEPYNKSSLKQIERNLLIKQCKSLILEISSIQSQKNDKIQDLEQLPLISGIKNSVLIPIQTETQCQEIKKQIQPQKIQTKKKPSNRFALLWLSLAFVVLLLSLRY